MLHWIGVLVSLGHNTVTTWCEGFGILTKNPLHISPIPWKKVFLGGFVKDLWWLLVLLSENTSVKNILRELLVLLANPTSFPWWLTYRQRVSVVYLNPPTGLGDYPSRVVNPEAQWYLSAGACTSSLTFPSTITTDTHFSIKTMAPQATSTKTRFYITNVGTGAALTASGTTGELASRCY